MNENNRLPRVAYFCMEFGLNAELPIYAGGLGILAGDYLKAAHDLAAPVVGVGILWAQDYTEQYIGTDGRPFDTYPDFSFPTVKDTGVSVSVKVRGEDVECRVKMVDAYENATLYLLDAKQACRGHDWMTCRLYGGNEQDRVAAEIILGIGGVRALRALGIETDIYHFNEGHAVFAGLELIQEKIQHLGMNFSDAWAATKKEVIFTTHTPVESGNEVHDHSLLNHMEANNGFGYQEMKAIGGDPFNMTAAGLRLSHMANAVSKLHGHTARRMWKDVEKGSPIISVTNGVHKDTWQDRRIRDAFEKGEGLRQAHLECKRELVDYIFQKTGQRINPEVLTVGFARRAAPYKRSDLIFRNCSLLDPALTGGRLQLVFSGKAHPNDQTGKEIITDLVRMDKKYGSAVIFLENYNMEVARMLVSGCDIWLNNPRRPLEASGTSGMKAALNGVLNLSVVDGWVGEGVQHGVSGWLLETAARQSEQWAQDEKDLTELYRVLFQEVMPIYYHDRERWEEMMVASIDMSRWQFSAERMLREYFDMMYQPALRAREEFQGLFPVHRPEQTSGYRPFLS